MSETVRFRDVRGNLPNRIVYLRIGLCVAACFTMATGAAWWTAGLVLTAFLLDIVDGRVARRLRQCSLVGDGLDWTADLFVDVLLMVWWGTLQPSAMPWLVLATMVEVSAALFDFAITAADRYPPRPRQSGFTVVLEWAVPAGRWTRFGWAIWLAFPLFVLLRCLTLAGALPDPAPVQGLLALLAVPAALFVWSNAALLASGLARWTERPRPPG